MRPRVFPAEDYAQAPTQSPSVSGFNEAAGIPRGRRATRRWRRRGSVCFNEAAGIPRGRHPRAAFITDRSTGFNEAAGIPRGRLRDAPRHLEKQVAASMRPRVFPAEDPESGPSARHRRAASMRPRVFPAEDVRRTQVARVAGGASMRPRVFPAEDAKVAGYLRGLSAALQ